MLSSRRNFLTASFGFGAVAASDFIRGRSPVWGQEANDRIAVAAIGVGGSRGRHSRGTAIAVEAAKLGQLIAVCDVDDVHNVEFNGRFDHQLNTYTDYRQLFENESPDVVTIGTPDHWHVPIAETALRAGCDVYCEKPLTLTIQEGVHLKGVVEETGRVFQVGTQQRSGYDSKFLQAIAMVQSGRLGKSVNAFVAVGGGPVGATFKTGLPPSDLDWDMWLGPAPDAEYCEERRQQFRWFSEYSGGKMTDWGAHHVDIAQWALGCEDTGPIRVSAKGTFPPAIPDDFNWLAYFSGEATLPNTFNAAVKFSIDLEFANGSILNVTDRYRREQDGIDFGNGILFEGDAGRIFVSRGNLSGRPVEELTEVDKQEISDRVHVLYQGRSPGNHMENFFECVRERVQPISDVVTHHRTMTSCHLCNIALWLGRDLVWNPDLEEFVGDDQANLLRARSSRAGFV